MQHVGMGLVYDLGVGPLETCMELHSPLVYKGTGCRALLGLRCVSLGDEGVCSTTFPEVRGVIRFVRQREYRRGKP